jgi:hypothetical protein
VQVSPRRPIWNVNRTREPGGSAPAPSVLRSACLRASGASPRHSANFRARSSKRADGLIIRVALDECLVPERYRTRVPSSSPCGVAQPTRLPLKQEITGAKPVRDGSRLHAAACRFLLYRNPDGASPSGGSNFARVVQAFARGHRRDTSRASAVRMWWPCAGTLPRAPIWPASFKVKQRSFKPLNSEHYRGGPPILPGRLIRRTAPFEGAYVGANPAPAANSRSVVK